MHKANINTVKKKNKQFKQCFALLNEECDNSGKILS